MSNANSELTTWDRMMREAASLGYNQAHDGRIIMDYDARGEYASWVERAPGYGAVVVDTRIGLRRAVEPTDTLTMLDGLGF